MKRIPKNKNKNIRFQRKKLGLKSPKKVVSKNHYVKMHERDFTFFPKRGRPIYHEGEDCLLPGPGRGYNDFSGGSPKADADCYCPNPGPDPLSLLTPEELEDWS